MVNQFDSHHGRTLEKVIRKNGHSISNIARMANVNRRCVYNWFTQRRLKLSIVKSVGEVIDYDFSREFPDLFPQVVLNQTATTGNLETTEAYFKEQKALFFWKNKYLNLLEQYEDLLTKELLEMK
jgi:hypothetical protein